MGNPCVPFSVPGLCLHFEGAKSSSQTASVGKVCWSAFAKDARKHLQNPAQVTEVHRRTHGDSAIVMAEREVLWSQSMAVRFRSVE